MWYISTNDDGFRFIRVANYTGTSSNLKNCSIGHCGAGKKAGQVRLVTASGEPIPIVGSVTATVCIGELRQPIEHEFLVVQNLVSPVILGVDFMQQHGVVLDFSADPVGIRFSTSSTSFSNRLKNPLVATINSDLQDADSDDVDMGDEGTIPSFIDDGIVTLPSCADPVLMPIVRSIVSYSETVPGERMWANTTFQPQEIQ